MDHFNNFLLKWYFVFFFLKVWQFNKSSFFKCMKLFPNKNKIIKFEWEFCQYFHSKILLNASQENLQRKKLYMWDFWVFFQFWLYWWFRFEKLKIDDIFYVWSFEDWKSRFFCIWILLLTIINFIEQTINIRL